MGSIDRMVADLLIKHGVDLLRFAVGVRGKVIAILRRLEGELTVALLDEDLSAFKRARATSMLRAASADINAYYQSIATVANDHMVGVASAETQAIRQALKAAARTATVSIEAALPTENVLRVLARNALIHGAPSSAWWQRQGADTAFRFGNEVRQGIAQGETSATIVARIAGTVAKPGVMNISRNSAAKLVQASVATVSAQARIATFEQNADVIDGITQVSTLDGRTTDVCLAYDGAEWDMNYEPINGTTLPYNGGVPRHWNCRSVMVPIVKTFADMGIDLPELPKVAQRAAKGGPVAGDMSMQQWMDRRTEAQLDEQLGRGRAKLYRDRVITLQQLLDQSGNPLTLEQLTARYAMPA